MKNIYNLLADRLQTKVPELKWIDFDNGQLDFFEYRANVDFPAVLINLRYPVTNTIGTDGVQECLVEVELRAVFNLYDETNIAAPLEVRERALAIYDTLDLIQQALQNWRNDGTCGVFERKSLTPEKRNDGTKVFSIVYNTTYFDPLAVRADTEDVDVEMTLSQE